MGLFKKDKKGNKNPILMASDNSTIPNSNVDYGSQPNTEGGFFHKLGRFLTMPVMKQKWLGGDENAWEDPRTKDEMVAKTIANAQEGEPFNDLFGNPIGGRKDINETIKIMGPNGSGGYSLKEINNPGIGLTTGSPEWNQRVGHLHSYHKHNETLQQQALNRKQELKLEQLRQKKEALMSLGENISDMFGGNNTGFQYDLLGDD